ncbi:hypothetical protein [Streptomyces sp. NPDC059814]|uniref:hypothetical protein n=1 Tax=unclassified Streptomyces TaxID=2593676 RepID=UPI0036685E95
MDFMYGVRVALWSAGIVALGVALIFVSSGIALWLFVLCFVLAFVFPVAAEVYADLRGRREKRESYVRTFGSVDELRLVIDGPGLRRIRDEDGLIVAVRELRSRHPGLPLDMAVTLLKEL